MDKKCPVCKQVKLNTEFYNNRSKKDGKEWCCKPCHREVRHKAYLKKRKTNIKQVRQWQMDNPVKVNEYKQKFHQENPMKGRYANLKNKNRAEMELSQDEFLAWYDKEPKQCFYCGIPISLLSIPDGYIHRKSNGLFTIDRKDPRGNYAKGNIVLACHLCNLMKSNFFDADTMRELAQRYIKPRWQQEAGIEPTKLLPNEKDIRKAEGERIMKIFASLGKIQLKKPLSGREFESLFD